MTAHYAAVKEIYTFGAETRISYGVAAFYEPEENGTLLIVASVRDVTSDPSKAESFAKHCNDLQLPTTALCEKAEDFFG